MTITEIFRRTMDLLNKRNRSGEIDANKTARYNASTLGILNTFLMDNKIYTVTVDTATYTDADWDGNDDIIYTLPADTALIESITLTPDALYTVTPDSIIIHKYVGELRAMLHTYPAPLTAFTDDIPAIYATAGVYFLAASLLVQEDPNVAQYYNDRYEEAGRRMHRPRTTQVKDCY